MIPASKASRARVRRALKGKTMNEAIAKNRNRRESIYLREWYRYGMVPCYVCGSHVKKAEATLEHIKPKSLGGSDDASNLAISHPRCNNNRGSRMIAHRAEPLLETKPGDALGRQRGINDE